VNSCVCVRLHDVSRYRHRGPECSRDAAPPCHTECPSATAAGRSVQWTPQREVRNRSTPCEKSRMTAHLLGTRCRAVHALNRRNDVLVGFVLELGIHVRRHHPTDEDAAIASCQDEDWGIDVIGRAVDHAGRISSRTDGPPNRPLPRFATEAGKRRRDARRSAMRSDERLRKMTTRDAQR
jgi:hypothetical protein